MPTIFLGLGSNLDDRRANLRRAVSRLGEHYTQTDVSSLYDTDPLGYLDQPAFLNAIWQGETEEGPEAVFAWIKELEQELGRTPTFPNGPRVIDIDLLLYGDVVVSSPDLTVPHPRLHQRAFVLAPLAEIAPDAVHPALNLSVGQLLAQLPSREGVRKIEDQNWWR